LQKPFKVIAVCHSNKYSWSTGIC